jgi:hypothetical protein
MSFAIDAEIAQTTASGNIVPGCINFPSKEKTLYASGGMLVGMNLPAQRDNRQATINHDSCAIEFQHAPQSCRAYAQDKAKAGLTGALYYITKMHPSRKLLVSGGGPVSKKFLKTAPPEAFYSGCNETRCAFMGGEAVEVMPDYKQHVENVGIYLGTHIHQDLAQGTRNWILNGQSMDLSTSAPMHTEFTAKMEHLVSKEQRYALVGKLFTLICGVPCAMVNRDDEWSVRRARVMPVGGYRPKTYGIEYKDVSSAILRTPAHLSILHGVSKFIETIFTSSMQTGSYYAAKQKQDLVSAFINIVDDDELVTAMRTYDADLLFGIWHRLKPVIISTAYKMDYVDVNGPFCPRGSYYVYKGEEEKVFTDAGGNGWSDNAYSSNMSRLEYMFTNPKLPSLDKAWKFDVWHTHSMGFDSWTAEFFGHTAAFKKFMKSYTPAEGEWVL